MLSKRQIHETLVLASVAMAATFATNGFHVAELLMPTVLLGYAVMALVLSYAMRTFGLNTPYKWALLGLVMYLPGLVFGIVRGNVRAFIPLAYGVALLVASGYAVSRM